MRYLMIAFVTALVAIPAALVAHLLFGPGAALITLAAAVAVVLFGRTNEEEDC